MTPLMALGIAALCIGGVSVAQSPVTASSRPELAELATGDDARPILERQKELHDAPHEIAGVEMTLVDRRGRERQRQLRLWNRQVDAGRNQTLLKFAAPADIRNTGVLTWEQEPPREDDQWLFLPAGNALKRIAGGGKKNQFMGTDLAFVDLRPENLDLHEYRIESEEACGEARCWVIDALPRDERERRDSGYARRRLWVRQDRLVTVRVEYFNLGDRLVKTALHEQWRQVDGGRWRSDRSTFERLRSGTSTVLETVERDLSTPIADALLTQQGLRRPLVD